jgi:Secretion system C-terminal sorting domain
MGWTNGTISDPIDLSYFWQLGNPGWQFEESHAYTVQFVVENRQCRNGIEIPGTWNNNDRIFFICPSYYVCRFGEDQKEIAISPNPANSFIRLQNFEPDLDRDYQLVVTDLAGRSVKTVHLTSGEVDVSGLQNGMFVVSVLREGKNMFTSKLVVNH